MSVTYRRSGFVSSLRGALVGVALTAGLLGASVRSAHGDPGDPKRATIIVKALSFDLDLDARIGDELVFALVFKKGDALSEASAATWMHAFSQLGNVRVKNAAVRAVLVPLDPDVIKDAVQKRGVDVLLACDGLDADVDSIVRIASANKVMTVGARRVYVEKGLVLGVFLEDDKSRIVVNLEAARRGGFRFSSSMLRLAILVK